MANATSYALLTPPEVTSGETSIAVVVLAGGEALTTPLTVTLSGGSPVAFDGPVVIPSGSTWGSTRFRATGPGGSASISATHSGGIPSMSDPAPSSLTIRASITPTEAAATWWSAWPVTPPPGYTPPGPQGNAYPFPRPGKVGETVTILVQIQYGATLPAPLVVTLADDAGGSFTNNPATITGTPGFAFVGYRPMAPGLRAITATATGGGGLPHLLTYLGLDLSPDLEVVAVE